VKFHSPGFEDWRGFPGLLDALKLIDECAVEEFPQGAIVTGVERHLDQVRSGEGALAFVTSLTPSEIPRRAHAGAAAGRAPSHLLLDHHAYAIRGGLKLGANPTLDNIEDRVAPLCTVYMQGTRALLENHSAQGTIVNEAQVLEQVELTAGDRITIGSTTLLLICAD